MKYLVIPTEWLDSDLTYREMIVLAELVNLSQGRKCTASNEYLSNTLKISKKNVSNVISSLQDKGYINSEIESGSRNKHRIIIVNDKQNKCPQKVDRVSTKNGQVSTNRGRVSTKSGESKEKNKEINKENNINPSLSPLSQKQKNQNKKKTETTSKQIYPAPLREWINYRKEIKKPLKQRTIDKLLRDYELNPLAFEEKVEFSIANGYQGLFAPKSYKAKGEPEVGSINWILQQQYKQAQAYGDVIDTVVDDE